MREEWNNFTSGIWVKEINVRDFIQLNYTPYTGNEDFLAGPTARTKRVYSKFDALLKIVVDGGGDEKEDVVLRSVGHVFVKLIGEDDQGVARLDAVGHSVDDGGGAALQHQDQLDLSVAVCKIAQTAGAAAAQNVSVVFVYGHGCLLAGTVRS